MICHSRDNVHQIHWLHVTSIIKNMFTYRVWKEKQNHRTPKSFVFRAWSNLFKARNEFVISSTYLDTVDISEIMCLIFFLTDIVWDLLKKQSNMLHKRYHVHCTTQEAPIPAWYTTNLQNTTDWDEPWNQTCLLSTCAQLCKELGFTFLFFFWYCA